MSLTSRRTVMPRKRYKPEEIVAKLRQVDVLVSQGQNMVDAIRQIGVSEVTYYRWRQEFGGLKIEQVKRLKKLETENGRLRKAIADSTPVWPLRLPRDRTLAPALLHFIDLPEVWVGLGSFQCGDGDMYR